METYLVIYDVINVNESIFDIQKVEGYWDLVFERQPWMVVRLTDDMIEKLKELG